MLNDDDSFLCHHGTAVEVEVDELLDEPPAPALEAPAGWSQLTPAASSGQRQASPERHPPGLDPV